jgi:Do/DeqQ family serine protease
MRPYAVPIFLFALILAACNRPAASAAQTPQSAPEQSIGAGLPGHGSAGATQPSLAPMLAKVSPAVVNISVQGTVKVTQSPLFQDPLFRKFFNLPDTPASERFQAVGSGVIYDAAKGYVITNNHVIDRADKIVVTLRDRRQLDAKLVATDPQTDVAVLKVSPDHLTALPLGNSSDLKVGDYVVAIGDPYGLGQTATFGIVSALGRTGLGIEGYEDFIQTDASINPGNSGGALVDMNGRLIGINTAILSRSGGNVGIGFAIPIDMVKAIAQQLITTGKVSRGELGVSIQDLTPALAQAMGVQATGGAVVAQVIPRSAAAAAGIQAGDVLTALNGKPLADSTQLRNTIGQTAPGTQIHLTLLRDGKERTVSVTLQPQAGSEQTASAAQPSTGSMSGLTLAPIPQDNPLFGTKGVYVVGVAPGSAAEDAGIEQGDVITSIAKIVVGTPQEAARLLRSRKQGVPVLVRIRRGNAALYTALG